MKALDSGNFFQKSRRMEMDLKDNVDLLFLLCLKSVSLSSTFKKSL